MQRMDDKSVPARSCESDKARVRVMTWASKQQREGYAVHSTQWQLYEHIRVRHMQPEDARQKVEAQVTDSSDR